MESHQDNMPEHSLPVEILDIVPEISEITNHARTARMVELGIQLKLDDVDRQKCNDCAALYQLWLQEKGRHATRRLLLAALRAIRQNAVADSYVAHLQTITLRANHVSQNTSSVTHPQETFDTCDGSHKASHYNNMGATPANQGVNAGCEDIICPIPKEDSEVVLSEKKALLGALNMQRFAKNLNRVGTFINIAYTCFVAAGPKFKTFQFEMRKLGVDTERLLNNSSSAINEFISASQKMLSHLEAAYGYLVEDNAALSIKRLHKLEYLAKESSSVARKLSSHFTSHEQQVSIVLQKTLEENPQPEYQRKCILQKEENSCNEKRMESYYQRKERNLEKKLQEITVVTHYDMLLSTFSSPEDILDIKNDMKLSQTHQEKDTASDLKNLDEFIIKFERGGSEVDLVSFSILSLHYASCALHDLQNVMLNVANYWNLVQIYCAKHLSESCIREDIEASHKVKPEKKLWKSLTFKKSFMKFCAQFVALRSVSAEFLDQIKLIQMDFCKDQRIILTYENARQILILHCRKAEDALINSF